MTGFARAPDLNMRSWPAMYTALWPASRGHRGLVLLPLTPWQAEHTAALVAPSATLPCGKGKVSVGEPAAEGAGVASGAAAGACARLRAGVSSPVRATSVKRTSLEVCGIAGIRSSFPRGEGAELYTTAVRKLSEQT